MMNFKWTTGKRMENNLADTKPVYKRNYVIVGTDGKGKSFTTTIKDVTLLDARIEGKSWAKSHGLTLDVVRATN